MKEKYVTITRPRSCIWINLIKYTANLIILKKMIKLAVDNDSIEFYNLTRLRSKIMMELKIEWGNSNAWLRL